MAARGSALCPTRQLTSNMTISAKPKVARYKTSELHDNHAGKSNAKSEVSIPNLLAFAVTQSG